MRNPGSCGRSRIVPRRPPWCGRRVAVEMGWANGVSCRALRRHYFSARTAVAPAITRSAQPGEFGRGNPRAGKRGRGFSEDSARRIPPR